MPEIQSILDNIPRASEDRTVQLSIINVAGQPFLVWAESVAKPPAGALRSDADPARLVQLLKLQGSSESLSNVTRSWYETSNGVIHCFQSSSADCIVTKFWEGAEATPWHTDDLARATKKIQEVLDNVAKRNTDPNQHLAILFYNYRPLLAWVHHDGVNAQDDTDTVIRALRLKTE